MSQNQKMLQCSHRHSKAGVFMKSRRGYSLTDQAKGMNLTDAIIYFEFYWLFSLVIKKILQKA